MKFVIAILIALAGAIALAMYATQDPGYVVLSHAPYTVRLPLALFVLFVLIGFAVLYLLINFIVGIVRTPGKIGKWRIGRKQRSAQQHTMKGFAGLIEGDWNGAEKHLLNNLDHNNASLMNYLGAAYAAQQQGQLARRNQHLQKALEENPRQELAIKITRARMFMQAGEWADARDQLEYLRLNAPKNVAVARLLADSYRKLGDWEALVKLQPTLAKLKAFPETDLEERNNEALKGYIESPALLQGEEPRLDKAYKSLSRKARKDDAATAGYVRQLIRSGDNQRAEKELRKALNRHWQSELVRLYGALETRFVGDQIKLLKSWARKHQREEDPDYLLAMAQLQRRDNQLEPARKMLSRVVSETGDPEALNELGELLEQMGEQDSAIKVYKEGLKAATGATSLTPRPDSGEGTLIALDGDSYTGAGDKEPVHPNAMPVVSDPKTA